jgi:methionyl-tRNA formyltransferase
MKNKNSYVVVGSKPWNLRIFEEVISKYPGKWLYVGSRKELTPESMGKINPSYIFFLHWSWKVPLEIIENYECVCFHMTDVPYGRGGSPLQNLIVRGHRSSKLTALRMVEDFDAGPVYFKKDLSLEGNAEEIYIRASYLSAEMIHRIVTEQPLPQPQMGEAVIFKRRTPRESRIPELPTIQALYDFIRMLDAEGYPRAFVEHSGFCYEFSRPAYYDGKIIADVVITPKKGKNK